MSGGRNDVEPQRPLEQPAVVTENREGGEPEQEEEGTAQTEEPAQEEDHTRDEDRLSNCINCVQP